MTTHGKRSDWRSGTVSWKRVGMTVLAVAGVGLLAGIVSVHRAGIPQRPDPTARRDPGSILVSVAGTVSDTNGEARPGVDVYLALWRGKAGLGTVGHMVTDATGRYRFSSLDGYDPNHPSRRGGRTVLDWPYYVFATAPGRGFGCLEFEPTRDIDDGDIRLHTEHRLSGTVTDATGNPLTGAMVSLARIEIPDATGTPQPWDFLSVRAGALPPPVVTTTNSEGEFVLSGLPSGDGIELRTELEGYFHGWIRHATEGEPVPIVLRKEMTLTGKVVVEGSSLGYVPAFKLTVHRSEGDLSLPVDVRSDGSFQRVLETGQYEITLESSRIEADPVHVHLTLETSGRPVVIRAREIAEEGA